MGFTFEPIQDVVTFFGLFWRPHFVADPGVNETLEVDNITLTYGDDGTFRMFGFGVPYNPSEYTLVTKDGVRWTYDQFEGLRHVEDRNGNTPTFTDAGIFASNGTSVQFVRDSQNRITEIIDPEGNSLHYTYDADGNLVKFEDQIGTKTSYFYDDATRPHYLTELTNPGCGCRFDTYLRTQGDRTSNA